MGEREDIRRGKENMRDQLMKSGMPYKAADRKATELARRNEDGRGVKPNPRAHTNEER